MTLKDFLLFSQIVPSEENHSKAMWKGQYNALDDADKERKNPSKTWPCLQRESVRFRSSQLIFNKEVNDFRKYLIWWGKCNKGKLQNTQQGTSSYKHTAF